MYVISLPTGEQMRHTRSWNEEGAWEKFAQGGDLDLFQSLGERAGYRLTTYEPLDNEYE